MNNLKPNLQPTKLNFGGSKPNLGGFKPHSNHKPNWKPGIQTALFKYPNNHNHNHNHHGGHNKPYCPPHRPYCPPHHCKPVCPPITFCPPAPCYTVVRPTVIRETVVVEAPPVVIVETVVVKEPVAEEAPAANLPEIPAGEVISLNGKDLTKKAGRVMVQIGDLTLEATVIKWEEDKVTLQMPMLGVNAPKAATLYLLLADGELANTIDFMLVQASDKNVAAK